MREEEGRMTGRERERGGGGLERTMERVRIEEKGGMLCVPWCEGGAINTAGTPPEAGFIQQLSFHRFS